MAPYLCFSNFHIEIFYVICSNNDYYFIVQLTPGESFPIVYTVPPVWKRIVAEVLDFLILFTLKVCPTGSDTGSSKKIILKLKSGVADPDLLFCGSGIQKMSIWIRILGGTVETKEE